MRSLVKRFTGVLALLAASMGSVLLGAAPASAHATLVRADPASGSVLGSAPPVVRLWFSEDVAAPFTSVKLMDGSGHRIDGVRAGSSGVDQRLVEVVLPKLGSGAYAVVWSVLAEDDGHRTSGVVAFNVGGNKPLAHVATPRASWVPLPVGVVLRWIRLALLAGVLGALAVVLLVLEPSTHPLSGDPRSAAALLTGRWRLFLVASGCALLALPATLVDVAVEGGPSGLGQLLTRTTGGRLVLLQLVVLLALALIFLRRCVALRGDDRPAGRELLIVVATLVATLTLIEALRSHAASLDTAGLLVTTVHITAALVWLGALPALLIALMPGGRAVLRSTRGAFSRLVAASVVAVAATGLYAAGREVRLPSSLAESGYGRGVLAKGALLAVVLAIALVNHRRLHQPGGRLSRRLVVMEAAVGSGALLVAALLAQTLPSPRVPLVQADGARPVTDGHQADLVVSASASPDRPGDNAFTVLAASSLRPEPSPIDGVRLRLPHRTDPIRLTRVEPGRYVGTARIPASGLRSAEVLIARSGTVYDVPLRWRLASPPRLVPASDARPLASYTTPLALALLGAVALVPLTGHLRRRLVVRKNVQEAQG
ncbi:MAG: copper resistance protein CopC [Nocardioides sp.]|nr:copper resistance protein CopC [Nocardioides sp.]